MLRQLWRDDNGAILSAELVLLMTLLVIGLVAGIKALNAAVAEELGDVAAAIGNLDQSYYYSGTRFMDGTNGPCAKTQGAAYSDEMDQGDVQTDNAVQVCGQDNIPGEQRW